MKSLNFDTILPVEVPIILGGVTYKLVEPSGKKVKEYRERLAKCSKMDGGKITATDVGKAAEAGMHLLSTSLLDPEGKSVPVEVINEWRNEVVEALMKAIMSMAGFNSQEDATKAEDEVKNS